MTLKNTDGEYIISVRNTQTIDDRKETVQEKAFGSCREKDGKLYITYKTKTEDGAVMTLIKLDGTQIHIKRSGAVNSAMIYQVDKNKSFIYETPYGAFEMEINTQRIISDLTIEGGSIKMMYTLTIGGEKYYNDMRITVNKR